ncbi:MAG: homocysteine S-methyltransferase family protein [Patescibacteria group bacterium]|nr:homocysteine S-methyltransferase family protein [Patescibacteria group bacterium]
MPNRERLIERRLADNPEPIITDGATGTVLRRRLVELEDVNPDLLTLWMNEMSEKKPSMHDRLSAIFESQDISSVRQLPIPVLTLVRPEIVIDAHTAYADAGAQWILTNTFIGSDFHMTRLGLQGLVYEMNRKAALLVRLAGDNVYVVGDIGPSGQAESLVLGNITQEELIQSYISQVCGLLTGGVDLFHIETMESIQEVLAAIEAIKQACKQEHIRTLPIVATMSFNPPAEGKTRFRTAWGASPAQLVVIANQQGLFGCGANCGMGLEGADDLLSEFIETRTTTHLVMKMNAGIAVLNIRTEETTWPATPGQMADYAVRMRDLGARIIGACCGSTPAHIEAMANTIENLSATY